MAPEFPRKEKGAPTQKPEMDPRKEKPDKKENEPNWGIPDTSHLPFEDQPSPQMGRAQADFMKPEQADSDSNRQSGAV